MNRQHDELDKVLHRRGFTLVEVLVAILVLLVGVVVALSIFPRGFDIFTRTQLAASSIQQVKDQLQMLTDHPENLMDSIEPAPTAGYATCAGNVLTFSGILFAGGSIIPAGIIPGMKCSVVGAPTIYIVTAVSASTVTVQALDGSAPTASATPALWTFYDPVLPSFTWSNLSAVSLNGFDYQSYGFGGTGGQWLLNEPMSLRVLRRIVGERCVIPSTTVSTAIGSQYTYCVRYGPIEPAADPLKTLTIYDLRYRRLNQNKFPGISNSPDGLYYDIDYGNANATPPTSPKLFFPPTENASGQYNIRVSFACENTTTNQITQFPAMIIPVNGSIGMQTVSLAPYVQSGYTIEPGSEQIYRAYTAQNASTNLNSGQYYLQPPPPGAIDPVGLISFSSADAGRSVKIDYTVLDWNIMHDDVTVDQSGALELGIVPKLADQPLPPFETKTWALYGQIASGSIVMEMVNLQTGVDYPVTVDNPELGAAATIATVPDPSKRNYSFSYNGAPYYLVQDTTDAKHFFLSQTTNSVYLNQGGLAFAGQTFRVYYRAVHNASMQIFRAPATFQQVNSPVATPAALPATLQWSQFAWALDPTDAAITVASISASNNGSTPPSGTITCAAVPAGVVSGMYASEAGDATLYAVTGVTATTVTLAPAPTITAAATWTFATRAWLAVQGFFAGQTLAVDYSYAGNPAIGESPFVRVSGEVHTVPAPAAGQSLSTLLLAHCPAAGTPVSVRGISVTVRALWTQMHSGPAVTLQDSATSSAVNGSIGESWLSRSATGILPANTE